MLEDIKRLTELYLHSQELLSEGKSWGDFHDELIQNASKDSIGLLVDVNPKDRCKYALFVDVDTKKGICEVKNFVEIGAVENWSSHLFWQGSGGSKSKDIRNTPHDYFGKGGFPTDKLIVPLKTILEDYCQIIEGKGKKKTIKETGPLFWNVNRKEERRWLENVIDILEDGKEELAKQVKGEKSQQGKFPPTKPGDSVFVGLTIDGKPIGEYELFRRYLLFTRIRAGVKNGAKKFKNRIVADVIEELKGICPSCQGGKPLLNQWTVPAELSFYQMTYESFSSYAYSSASFHLCQSCSDLLFIFKQRILERSTRKLGGNECLILPSIKLVPSDQNEKKGLYENLERLWDLSDKKKVASIEEGLLYRLGQLPSYATATFIFGNFITIGKSKNVRRLDELNVTFPDVLPSRLSKIATAIKKTNQRLYDMWSLTGRNWNCTWSVRDDFQLLQELFHPLWDEDKKNKDKRRKRYKSLRRPEIERYLRAIFYGEEISHDGVAEDCYSNLVSAIRTSRNAADEDEKAKYAKDNYIGSLLSLFVFLGQLREINEPKKEGEIMPETEKIQFSFMAMPDLGKFVKKHPLFKDDQYLAPFFVGCLFSYAENLQKKNSRLVAYNWLGTMALTYEDILRDIYPKVLSYIKNRPKKESIISSTRLQELMSAIAHYDCQRSDNDRLALVSFCHGWAVGRSFIYKKEGVRTTNQGLEKGGNNDE